MKRPSRACVDLVAAILADLSRLMIDWTYMLSQGSCDRRDLVGRASGLVQTSDDLYLGSALQVMLERLDPWPTGTPTNHDPRQEADAMLNTMASDLSEIVGGVVGNVRIDASLLDEAQTWIARVTVASKEPFNLERVAFFLLTRAERARAPD
jgi:hypothetical protein